MSSQVKMRESREELARVYKVRLKEMQVKVREQKEDKVSWLSVVLGIYSSLDDLYLVEINYVKDIRANVLSDVFVLFCRSYESRGRRRRSWPEGSPPWRWLAWRF